MVVDERYRTNVPGIFAIGDVIDRVQLTPVALAEAMALVDSFFGERRAGVDYMYIPTAVFTHPNIGTVGFTEAAARGPGSSGSPSTAATSSRCATRCRAAASAP